jgi:type II secretory pathway pseudopilin PulG
MEKRMTTGDPREAGFSMVELLVAMVITLMISGAIFGLLTGGQNAFRREPEMTDRQQNIRVAMDLIRRDVAGAGAGMAPFVQAFTNGLNGAGPNPSSTQTTGAIAGQATDVLEVLTTTGDCPAAALAPPLPNPATGPLNSNDALPRCFPDVAAPRGFFYVGSTAPADLNRYGVVMGKADVAAGTSSFNIILQNPTTQNYNPVAPNPAPGFCSTATCTILIPISVVRYVVAPDPDDATLPALWRSRTGAFTATGAASATPPGANWEVIARGIEDLQVDYMNGGGAWATTPGAVFSTNAVPVAADINRVVRQVRVTLSGRAVTRARIQGATQAGGGNAGSAIRGQLVAVMTPRAALTALTTNPAAPGWY